MNPKATDGQKELRKRINKIKSVFQQESSLNYLLPISSHWDQDMVTCRTVDWSFEAAWPAVRKHFSLPFRYTLISFPPNFRGLKFHGADYLRLFIDYIYIDRVLYAFSLIGYKCVPTLGYSCRFSVQFVDTTTRQLHFLVHTPVGSLVLDKVLYAVCKSY